MSSRSEATNESNSEEDGMVAMVLFLDKPRALSEQVVRRCATEALGVTFDVDNPEALQFVMEFPAPPVKGIKPGSAQSFLLKLNDQAFLVNSFKTPYMEHPEEFADQIRDGRIRKAVSAHRAWISVDAMGGVRSEEGKARAYRTIGKMLACMAGPDCLAILCPELQSCNEYDSRLLETLRSENPLGLFDEPTFAPVLEVSDDDPRMVKAVAEAQQRWPEFVAAFRARSGDAPFLIKARFAQEEIAEYMWVSVTAIEGDTIRGILENAPNELTNLREKQPVSVPTSDLNDWIYIKGRDAVGGFTLKVLKEAGMGG